MPHSEGQRLYSSVDEYRESSEYRGEFRDAITEACQENGLFIRSLVSEFRLESSIFEDFASFLRKSLEEVVMGRLRGFQEFTHQRAIEALDFSIGIHPLNILIITLEKVRMANELLLEAIRMRETAIRGREAMLDRLEGDT